MGVEQSSFFSLPLSVQLLVLAAVDCCTWTEIKDTARIAATQNGHKWKVPTQGDRDAMSTCKWSVTRTRGEHVSRDRGQQKNKGRDRLLGKAAKRAAAMWAERQGCLDTSLELGREKTLGQCIRPATPYYLQLLSTRPVKNGPCSFC